MARSTAGRTRSGRTKRALAGVLFLTLGSMGLVASATVAEASHQEGHAPRSEQDAEFVGYCQATSEAGVYACAMDEPNGSTEGAHGWILMSFDDGSSDISFWFDDEFVVVDNEGDENDEYAVLDDGLDLNTEIKFCTSESEYLFNSEEKPNGYNPCTGNDSPQKLGEEGAGDDWFPTEESPWVFDWAGEGFWALHVNDQAGRTLYTTGEGEESGGDDDWALTITKQVSGGDAPDTWSFDFEVTCDGVDLDGDSETEGESTGEYPLTSADPDASISDIPSASTCDIEEVTNANVTIRYRVAGGAWTPYPASGVSNVGGGTTDVTVDFDNDFGTTSYTYACTPATNVTRTSATLNASTNDPNPGTATFTLTPGNSTFTDSSSSGGWSVSATGLSPNTTYSYTVSWGEGKAGSSACQFTTGRVATCPDGSPLPEDGNCGTPPPPPPPPPPESFTYECLSPERVTSAGATVRGDTDDPDVDRAVFTVTNSAGETTTVFDSDGSDGWSARASGLKAGTRHTYSVSFDGNEAESTTCAFTTTEVLGTVVTQPPAPPTSTPPEVIPATTVKKPEVKGVVFTKPAALARTGATTFPLAGLGVVFILLGALLLVPYRWRRTAG